MSSFKPKHLIRAIGLLLLATLFLESVKAQSNRTVSGKILSETRQPIVGANIIIEDSTAGATSTIDGSFTFVTRSVPPFHLYISATGYEPKVYLYTGNVEQAIITLQDNIKEVTGTEVVITARRRAENTQDVPIPVSVIGGAQAEEAGAFNVNRVKELVPTVQLYSSNPRNTTLNIRGMGSTFGLTNDGIDPGVGFYVDGVYYARPAATTLDFIDIEQIEVLRGPQGTLFGKNTTAGAFNITTRRPSFKPGANFELSYGNFGFVQAKTSITGPISTKFAGRLSFSGTQRDGLIENVRTQRMVNDLNNLGVRGQVLYAPTAKTDIVVAADYSRQRPDGYAQVYAGTAPTQRAEYRQFETIIKDLNYDLPSRNPFDRVIDHDVPWRSGQDFGGASVNVDSKIGKGTITSTTAWRYWLWAPSNDRDFTGLQGLALSQAPSTHHQWSQEVRYAGDITEKLSGVAGIYGLWQDLRSNPYHTEESGEHQWRFSQNSTSPLWQTPGLLDGYGIKTRNHLRSFGGAVFGQLDWAVTQKLHILPGIRFNYDEKQVDFERRTYGGLETDDPALLAIKRSVYSDQAFKAAVDEFNISGQLTVAYKFSDRFNTFGTYSTSYKPVGINLGGLPNANGQPMIELARIEPEFVSHYEFGIKTRPAAGAIVNVVFHNTDIKDYQTNVQAADLSVNRGYLANAERVNVKGVEVDGSLTLSRHLVVNTAIAYTDGRYVKFTNAPVPLEETGSANFKDISGSRLPGISRWAVTLGGELSTKGQFLNQGGKYFIAFDTYYRSSFSSSPSPSKYLEVDGYTLVNGRLGFRAAHGLSVFVWGRNILNKDYFEMLLPGAGNFGHYAAVLGDQRTYGITIRHSF